MVATATASSPARLAALLAPWAHQRPVYCALASGVRALVLDGRLPIGARLPSERALAERAGLSRTTVRAAYDVLRAQGYLRSDHGAGSHITLPASAPASPDAGPGEPAVVTDLTFAALSAPAQLLEAARAASEDLAPLMAGPGLYPFGLPDLRAAVATRLGERGLATEADQVLITGGALAGWNLLLRHLTRPGDRVMVEQPTYPSVLDAVRALHLRPLALAVDQDGWSLPPARGPRGLSQHAVLAHVTPDGQNPTGLLASAEQRRSLLAALDVEHVVVDETFVDLVFDAALPPPLAAVHDQRSPSACRVITVGSMSKAFWAGLRVGWIRADPEMIQALVQTRASVDFTSPVLEQLVATRLLDHAPQILAERRQGLRSSRDALLAALRAHLPTWKVIVPAAGLALWVELPCASATRVVSAALELGLRLTPGPRFTLDGTADRWLRLPFTSPPGQADTIAKTLAAAWQRCAERTDLPAHPIPRWTV